MRWGWVGCSELLPPSCGKPFLPKLRQMSLLLSLNNPKSSVFQLFQFLLPSVPPALQSLLILQSLQLRFQLVMDLRLQEEVISPDCFRIGRERERVSASEGVFFLLAYLKLLGILGKLMGRCLADASLDGRAIVTLAGRVPLRSFADGTRTIESAICLLVGGMDGEGVRLHQYKIGLDQSMQPSLEVVQVGRNPIILLDLCILHSWLGLLDELLDLFQVISLRVGSYKQLLVLLL